MKDKLFKDKLSVKIGIYKDQKLAIEIYLFFEKLFLLIYFIKLLLLIFQFYLNMIFYNSIFKII